MTAAEKPERGRGPRVSDELVESRCRALNAVASKFELLTDERAWFDLRDERASSAAKDAEIARLTAALATAERAAKRAADILHSEKNAQLKDFAKVRKTLDAEHQIALATARRDGWIEGRDAAAAEAEASGFVWSGTKDLAETIARCIRALTPPAVAEGASDD